MYNQFLQTGLDYLGAMNLAEQKVRFTGFSIGDSINFALDAAIQSPQGVVSYAGSNEQMGYIPITTEETIVAFKINDAADPVIGNIVLYVDDRVPLIIFRARSAYRKSMTQGAVAGDNYTFQFRLRIPGFYDIFDLGNLQDYSAKWDRFEDEFSVWAAFEDKTNQAFTETSFIGRPILLNNGGNQEWWGCPLLMRMDDGQFFEVDGGTAGQSISNDPTPNNDGYMYLKA